MYVDAVGTLPPVGISMLSVQIIPPVSGTAHLSFGLSARELHDVAGPGDRGCEIAVRERLRVVVARETPDLPGVDGRLDRVDRAVEGLVGHRARVVAVLQHDDADRVGQLLQHRDLALELRILEQLL